jgi:hypothetical protein
MSEPKPLLALITDAARFAVGQYFRPLGAVYRFFLPLRATGPRGDPFWRTLWDKLVRFTGQEQQWRCPWLNTSNADATPFHGGGAVFSAWSPSRMLGVRVIQKEATRDGLEIDFRHVSLGHESSGKVNTLVISCTLSEQTADFAGDLILSWMRYGKVSVDRSEEGPPVVAFARAERILRLPTPDRSPTFEPSGADVLGIIA